MKLLLLEIVTCVCVCVCVFAITDWHIRHRAFEVRLVLEQLKHFIATSDKNFLRTDFIVGNPVSR